MNALATWAASIGVAPDAALVSVLAIVIALIMWGWLKDRSAVLVLATFFAYVITTLLPDSSGIAAVAAWTEPERDAATFALLIALTTLMLLRSPIFFLLDVSGTWRRIVIAVLIIGLWMSLGGLISAANYTTPFVHTLFSSTYAPLAWLGAILLVPLLLRERE